MLHNQFIRVSPESAGISSRALLRLVDELKSLDSMHSIMVLRHGDICMEGWWKPYRRELPHALFSLSKSFTSVAIGLAQEEGLLSIDDTVVSFFPEYADAVTDERMKRVTLRHLLTMSSGHASCARPAMLHEPDGVWAKGFLASTLDYEPGTHFAYNSAGTYMLSAVIGKVTGETVRSYLMPRLFRPLGMTPGMWENSPQGVNTGGWGLYLKTEDIARFGQLVLQGGQWNGAQLLPADYLKAATSWQMDNSANGQPDWKTGYGYQFWISRHGFRGDGASGQVAVILPEQDMVIATTAGLANMQDVLTAFWEILLPGVANGPLPEDRDAQAQLKAALSNLEIPLAHGDITRRHAPAAWAFQDNPAGITEAAIEFGMDFCNLSFVAGGVREQVIGGFGKRIESQVLKLNDHLLRTVAADAAWVSDDKLEIHICSTEASFRDVITVDFSSTDEPLSCSCRFNTFREPFLPALKSRK